MFEQRFWSKVDKSGECWLWIASRDKDGYGKFRTSKNISWDRAHRIAWSVAYGPIPPGIHVLHRCDIPPCVNPSHLFLGTAKDNTEDMLSKGRESHLGAPRGIRNGHYTKPSSYKKGSGSPNAKLTEGLVLTARLRYTQGDTMETLAREMGVAKNTMRLAVRGITWGHVNG